MSDQSVSQPAPSVALKHKFRYSERSRTAFCECQRWELSSSTPLDADDAARQYATHIQLTKWRDKK